MAANDSSQLLPVIGGASDGEMAAEKSASRAASVDPTAQTPDDVYAVRQLQIHGRDITALVLVGLADDEAVRRYLARAG